ncbi:MAG: hypothetical protein QOH25_561 [Acidobacteriota bacterium]|jgi:hypothetical protein|nr:hypothetical protein [Acidobacteriota bacterium]
MRFEYYHAGLDDVRKLSIDGTVSNSVHFSHWEGNHTPPAVKADTSTEIALNLVGSPERERLTEGLELVTNNHFDTDGVLSVWTVLTGERAQSLREKLIAAAEAGDFSEYSSKDGVRASIVIQGSDAAVPGEDAGSPLARHLASGATTNEAHSYELILPEVERVLTHTSDYEFLWRDVWQRIEMAMESFARGESKVEEDAATGLSLVTLAPGLYGSHGFSPTRHNAPFTAISANARGQVFLVALPMMNGWSYRIDYPYYSWAETIVRPRIERRDFAPLIIRLNELEQRTAREGNAPGRWALDRSEMTSAVKFMDQTGTLCGSTLHPERVAEEVRATLNEAKTESVGASHGGDSRQKAVTADK